MANPATQAAIGPNVSTFFRQESDFMARLEAPDVPKKESMSPWAILLISDPPWSNYILLCFF
jgi:hypothetical protein